MSIRIEQPESPPSLAAEYVARAARLAPLLPHLHLRTRTRTRPLPADLLAYAHEPPRNLALELCRSILYEHAECVDASALSSPPSSPAPPSPRRPRGDSLWNNRPQQYFESMQYGERAHEEEYDSDSLAP